MSNSLIEIIQQNSYPLQPIETGLPAQLAVLPGIRCVLFDIYGTLFISGSGDVGTADEQGHETAFQNALKEVGIDLPDVSSASFVQEEIQRSHQESRANGVDDPEVEIREIWERVLLRMADTNLIPPPSLASTKLEGLCLHYEMLTNPVWPMPNCRECLEELNSRGLTLGIISNAQFYTPLLFEALLGESLEALGFLKPLQIFSFESRRAKPGLFLYEQAKQRLADLGILPHEVLYIGNDILKDVYPANQVGFRTALFAGDARSLRLRQDDDRITNRKPDLIITDLAQIPNCLETLR